MGGAQAHAQHVHPPAGASALAIPASQAGPAGRAAAAPAAPGAAAQPTGCRPNSFLDALVLVNASVKASGLMGAGTGQTGAAGKRAAAVQAELDAILGMAIKQAKAELPCVTGKLEHGYDRSYAHTMRTAHTYALARRLPAATVAAAGQVADALEQPAQLNAGRTKP